MTDLSLIIPFLNESENISYLFKVLNDYWDKHDLNVEVIFVDDGSNDNSVEILLSQKCRSVKAKLVKLSKNYGSHNALRAGIQVAEGKYIGFTYADLQDPIELQLKMYEEAVAHKANIIWGIREESSSKFLEKAFSKWYASLMKKFVDPKFPNKNFDIVLFDEKVKHQVNANIEANSSIFLQILSLGYNQRTVNYIKKERVKGKSKWTLAKKIKLFIDSFVAFSYFPIKLVTNVGFIFFIIGILWTIYIVSRQLIFNDLATGWPALVSILMIGFGVTNIGIGIVAEYLWRTLDSSRKRPVFIINEIIDLNKQHE
jgi:dolichol-phosphate mannosyltransferase